MHSYREMPTHASSLLPDLILIDLGAPLEECVRRLQSHLARVQARAAHEVALRDPTSYTPPAALVQAYRGTSAAAAVERDIDDGVALRRRVAQKLRRLSEQYHVDLRTQRSSIYNDGDEDMSGEHIEEVDDDAAAQQQHQQQASSTLPPPATPNTHAEVLHEEEDLFGWVTEPAEAPTEAAAAAVAVSWAERSRPATAADEDATLRRIAAELADMVEVRHRHGERVDAVHRTLLQLQNHAQELLPLLPRGERATAQENSPPASAQTKDSSARNPVLEILSHNPSHTIATEEECGVWQRAWQAVLPSSSLAVAAPSLKVGDAIEAVDVAVLAHVNAQRYAALQRRWAAVQRDYAVVVEGLNRRLAQATLQLEEVERHHG